MCRFLQPKSHHIKFLDNLYKKYSKFLADDFNQDTIADIIIHNHPFFWTITTSNDIPVGFVYLENIVGNNNKLHSAEITTCFAPKYWGYYTKYCAKIFFNLCFKKYNFTKIKALVYPENSRVTELLKSCGFEKETRLKCETLKNGKAQDIDIYALYNTEYKEKRNEN